MRKASVTLATNISRTFACPARIAAGPNTGVCTPQAETSINMADIFPQWLDHPYSTTSTYYGIRDSFGGPLGEMPRLQDSTWTSPSASRGDNRGGRASTQNPGGQQGEYWRQPERSGPDFYAAVDSWRSYSNDAVTQQSSLAGQTSSNAGFDPYSQVFNTQAHGGQNVNQPEYTAQVPQRRSNTWRPSQGPTQTQEYQRQAVDAASLSQSNALWPQRAQRQAAAIPAHFTPYEPLRSVPEGARYHPFRIDNTHRFSNGLQEKPQQTYRPAGRSWRGPQPSFVQQVPIRPSRGADRSRGYSASPVQARGSIQREQASPNRRGDGQNHARQSTPRREYVPPPPPKPPVASQAYLSQAHLQPEKLKQPRRLLVILDLNGTLVLRPNFRKELILKRPGAPQLLEYLFAHHSVMVYTSAQAHNAEAMARALFSDVQYDKLAAIWARDKLGLTPVQFKGKVQVYKQLDKIWANNEIQASFFPAGKGKWDQTNTILVDDSHLKALQEPHNLLQVVEFTGSSNGLTGKKANKREEQICQSLVMKLEVLKWHNDVSRLIWRWQTGKAEIPKLPGSNFFVDERVDQQEQARMDLEAAMNLPTPSSPVTTDSEESEEDGGTVLAATDLQASFSPEGTHGESPVGEAVFKDLLAGGGGKKRQLRTPESSLDG